MSIQCGDTVKDNLSGLKGVVVARTEWLYGCIRIAILAEGSKDGQPYEPFWVDEPQVVAIYPNKIKNTGTKSGPKKDPSPARPSEAKMW